MNVIDIDSHSDPRPQDYVVESEYSHLKPRVYFDAKGNKQQLFNNSIARITTSNTMVNADTAVPAWKAARYDASIRYKHVTDARIDFQFVSAGIVAEFNYVDSKIGAAFCKASNDWLHNNFMKPYPKTFTGLPQLPLQETREAIKELERCIKDLNMRVFLMPTHWNQIDMADMYWWNFWESVRELGIRGIILHRGGLADPFIGQERVKVLGGKGNVGARIVTGPFEYTANIINLIFGGMMDNFPEFRFAFLEAGVEFAVVLKHRIQEVLNEVGYLRDKITQPVENYFKRFYFVVDDILLDDEGKRLQVVMDELGEDQLLFGSDYPHTDSHLSLGEKLLRLKHISTDTKEKIFGLNAITLLGGNPV